MTDTQVRNTQIKDEIKFLERDASREPSNTFKNTQVQSLKRAFKSQLDDFYKEESDYGKRYRDAIARQYRIVNPEATEQEVNEAANADWGEEGIFQQAVRPSEECNLSHALITKTAQEQPLRTGLKRPRCRPCASQRYPANRKDDERTVPPIHSTG